MKATLAFLNLNCPKKIFIIQLRYILRQAILSPYIKYKFKKKLESKVMFYFIVSYKGAFEPQFKPSVLEINRDVYKKQYFEKSYHSRKTRECFISQNIPFVSKNKNLANLHQFAQMKLFWTFEIKGLQK